MNNVAKIKVVMKEKLVRGLIGGLVGTIVFTLMGQYMAPKLLGQPMDVAALMAPMLGGSHTLGVIVHFIMGTFLFPMGYLMVGILNLKGPAPIRGAIFLTAIYLGAMTVMMPILGQGLFFNSMPKAMVALVAHIVFGLLMGAIIGKPNK
ncbi:DUF2938 domain-containing protein [Shewanella donghaensis]|uniref:DUF2938 domain-containing protein n=1 Tax=Shewanella donghaensis TaxID=238836 RepID=UPI0011821EF7|nr:DUF2938 domain-containing protein [Shewanella donghaensis]